MSSISEMLAPDPDKSKWGGSKGSVSSKTMNGGELLSYSNLWDSYYRQGHMNIRAEIQPVTSGSSGKLCIIQCHRCNQSDAWFLEADSWFLEDGVPRRSAAPKGPCTPFTEKEMNKFIDEHWKS